MKYILLIFEHFYMIIEREDLQALTLLECRHHVHSLSFTVKKIGLNISFNKTLLQ